MDDRPEAAELWRPLGDELDRWEADGRTARLWLRDDDAVEPTPALGRLAELTRGFDVPVVLAVVPARTGPALAQWLEAAPHVHPAVHGWAHHNHAPPAEKRQELGRHRPLGTVLDELAAALERMRDLHGERLLPMLVPPWNRIDPGLIAELPRLGFSALSVFGREPPAAPLPVVNTHVDLIDSRAGHRAREPKVLIDQLASELARSRSGDGHPVGVLSHHLADDAAALQFLERLFRRTAGHPACRWLGPEELVPHQVRRERHP